LSVGAKLDNPTAGGLKADRRLTVAELGGSTTDRELMRYCPTFAERKFGQYTSNARTSSARCDPNPAGAYPHCADRDERISVLRATADRPGERAGASSKYERADEAGCGGRLLRRECAELSFC